ncbi:MAG: NADH-quinone oxidoreductase subunit M, partial [Betaproteobacteria bacterium]|nr:NADH-quinone oxidoreductase subunit M [Betaproteobacteria bacterium]
WRIGTMTDNGSGPVRECLEKEKSLAGVVTTNSTMYIDGPPVFKDNTLDYKVASTHFEPDGTTVFKGSYELIMSSAVSRCIYKFSAAPISATVSITSENGEANAATTVINEKNGWLKLGAYGFLRFSLPIAPDASHELGWLVIALSLTAVVYIGLVALVQTDMKKLVAYSSIAHMGFVTLGFFMFNQLGMQGAIIQMISHGFISGAMFLCIGVLYDRMHSREIAAYGGVVNTMPKFAAFFLFFSMANAGLPATSGFVGEFMVILGAVAFNPWTAFAAAVTLVFGAAYSLWMYKRVVFGPVANHEVAQLKDINAREFLMLALLALLTLWMGIQPKPFTDVTEASVRALLEHVSVSKIK